MPSQSLLQWQKPTKAVLDELEDAHRAIGGQARGRRYATQQVNRGYALILSSRFQGYCRDLHTECADAIAATISVSAPANATAVTDMLHTLTVQGRKLDRGNPTLSALGADFGRFSIDFVPELRGSPVRPQVSNDLQQLERLNVWRNAIAHQDFDSDRFRTIIGSTTSLRLAEVKRWRKACDRLAVRMDRVMKAHLQSLLGTAPW